jgi:MerR family transcriptional regulator, heat shock protein HspR
MGRLDRDPTRPVYVISVAASIVSVHPRTLRIYEDEGLLCPARTATNIRLYSEEDVRRILWIRHLTQNRGVNLAGIRILFELEERLGTRILETLFDEANAFDDDQAEAKSRAAAGTAGQKQPIPASGQPTPVARRAVPVPVEGDEATIEPTRQTVGADQH